MARASYKIATYIYHNWERTHIYIYSSERVEYVLTGIHVYAIYMAIICNIPLPVGAGVSVLF